MANADIYVAFGADTGGLEAALALTKQNVTAMTRELNSLAKQMRTTGAAADSELGSKMKALGAEIALTKTQARDISGQLSGFSGAMHESAAAAHHGGTGLGFYVRELHALADEFGSGRTRQGIGSLSNLIFTFLQSRLSWIPYAAAVGAVAGAFGGAAYYAHLLSTATKSIKLDAAVNDFQLTDAAAEHLRDSIRRLAGVGPETAAAIAQPFLALGPAGEIVAQLVSPHLADLAAAMGKTAPEAAVELAKRFTDLDGEGRKFVRSSVLATQRTRQQYDAFVAAGDKGHAYGVIIDLTSRSLETHETRAKVVKAATIDHAAALGDAALAGGDMAAATAHAGEAVADAAAKVTKLSGELGGLRGQLDSVSSGAREMAAALGAGLDTALKVDRVTAEMRATNLEITRLEKGIEAAGDKSSPAIDEMSRALDIARDHLKKLRDESEGGLLGGSALERIRRGNAELADTFKGSQADLFKQQLAGVQGVANDPTKDAKQRADAALEASHLERQIRDADFEDEKNKDDQRATLAGKNSAAVIAIRQQEVARAIAVYGEGSREAQRAEEELARAKERGAERGARAATKAAKDELGATTASIDEQIRHEEAKTKATLDHLNAEVKLKQITEPQKAAAALAALNQEKTAVDALYAHEEQLAGLSLTKKQEIADKELTFQDQNALAIQEAQEKAAEATTKSWTNAANSIESAFNSQLRGLLSGQESWGTAMKKILADWVIEGIEGFEKFAVDAVLQYTVINNAAGVSGAVQVASQQAASASGIAALVANALKAAIVFGGETFGAVFANLAPVMGPLAAGPAAAAQATVISAASADIGMWNVPHDQLALVHKNEHIATPTEAGAIRSVPGLLANLAKGGGVGRSVSVTPTTNVNINALDGGSVRQFFADNAHDLLHSLNQAAFNGAHLALRRT